jgi:S1-C subfamily serine protease
MRPILASLALVLPLAAAEGGKPQDPPKPADAAVPAVKPGWLGVGIEEVDDALTYQLGLTNDLGVLVTQVVAGSPAEQMGMKAWDIVVAIGEQPVYTPRGLTDLVRARKAGEAVRVSVRRGAEVQVLSGALGEAPPRPAQQTAGPERLLDRLRGMRREHSRAGKVEGPDGNVMEWSIEGAEEPQGRSF